MEINRRCFMQMLGAVAASAVIPVPKFVLTDVGVLVPSAPVNLGLIRACHLYRPDMDGHLIRLEALNVVTREQIGIDFIIPNFKEKSRIREAYLDARFGAEQGLHDDIKQAGWNMADMRQLPAIPDYALPEWLVTA